MIRAEALRHRADGIDESIDCCISDAADSQSTLKFNILRFDVHD